MRKTKSARSIPRGYPARPRSNGFWRLSELDVVGLTRAGERPREAEAPQGRLGHALDARRVRRLAARVRVVREAADFDRVRRRPIAGQPDQVQMQGLAEPVQAAGELRGVAGAVVRSRRREEAVRAAARSELHARAQA